MYLEYLGFVLIRSLQVIKRDMSDVELEKEFEENRSEIADQEDSAEEAIGKIRSRSIERRRDGKECDVKFEQMLSLMKDINQKINKEVGDMRKEFRQSLEEILWEVKGQVRNGKINLTI